VWDPQFSIFLKISDRVAGHEKIIANLLAHYLFIRTNDPLYHCMYIMFVLRRI
jgi:hypothetical protein